MLPVSHLVDSLWVYYPLIRRSHNRTGNDLSTNNDILAKLEEDSNLYSKYRLLTENKKLEQLKLRGKR